MSSQDPIRIEKRPRDLPIGPKERNESPDPSRLNLLLVDDREPNLIALQAVLESLGHTLILARSGKEALKETARSTVGGRHRQNQP